MAEQYNRRFEGIWIPANIWLSETLTLQEKIFLVEIKSLDNEQGCFASNEHFSKLFQLSKSRCSEVINRLKEKNLIRIQFTYKEGSKQIERRTIRVNLGHDLFNEGIRKTEAPIREIERGVRYVEDPPSGNAKDNNTLFNNTSINTTATTNDRSREVFNSVQQNIRFNLSPIEIETVDYWLKDYPHELILEAIKRAALSNITTLRYIESILRDWQKKRLTTLAEVERDDEAFNEKKGGRRNGSNTKGVQPTSGTESDNFSL